MAWIFLFAVLLIVGIVINSALGMFLTILSITALTLILFFIIRRKAEENRSSRMLIKMANTLPKVILAISVILCIVGIFMFIIGISLAEDNYSFSGERCGICGGNGYFLNSRCKNCYGSGYEFSNNRIYFDCTWAGILMAISSAVVFITTIVNSDRIEYKAVATGSKKKTKTTLIKKGRKTRKETPVFAEEDNQYQLVKAYCTIHETRCSIMAINTYYCPECKRNLKPSETYIID